MNSKALKMFEGMVTRFQKGGSDGIVMLWLVYLGSSSSDQAVRRPKFRRQRNGEKIPNSNTMRKCSRHGGNHSTILGGETGSYSRAEVIISFVS